MWCVGYMEISVTPSPILLYAYLIAHTGQETVPISKDTMVTNNTDAPIALVGPTRITSSRCHKSMLHWLIRCLLQRKLRYLTT